MMRKLICTVFVLALMFCTLPSLPAKADGNLDEIENYKIIVNMEKDGTMDMTYHIDWKVLDSTSEGPLTWVKIGIPNQYADNLKALGSTISSISYLNDGGDYVRLDLDRSYNAGEIVPMDFSIHQSHMYTLDTAKNLCSYSFTPGWFDGADVKSMTIRWNNENVLSSDATKTDDGYLLWTTSLAAGERYSVSVNYNAGVFATSDDGQSVVNSGDQSNIDTSGSDTSYNVSDSGDSGGGFSIVVIIFILIAVIVTIINRLGGGGYRGGFGTRGGFIGGGVGHCACASSCACACACACAGGGRAGCSAKNLYGSALQTDKLQSILQQSSKSEDESIDKNSL